MTETLIFPPRDRRRTVTRRPLGDTLQRIAFLDPRELEALTVIAEMVLRRLLEQQEQQKA